MSFKESIWFLYRTFVLFFLFLFQFKRRKTCTTETTIICWFPNKDKVIVVGIFRGIRMNYIIFLYNSQGHQGHQAVLIITFMIIEVSSNIRYPQRVAVTCNTCNYTIMYILCFIILNIAKSKRICTSDHFCTHAHDISNISPNARSSPFIRDYLRWVIMRFMAHDYTPPISVFITSD